MGRMVLAVDNKVKLLTLSSEEKTSVPSILLGQRFKQQTERRIGQV